METFVNYRGYRYLWLSVTTLVLLTIVYRIDSPIGGPSGGSFLGYTYGGLSTAGILYLMWYGMRKRSFYSNLGTVRSALAAHVWLGLALVILVPLHCAFSFGLNVHTLAYVLMVATVLSGVWGAVNYSVYPMQIPSHRGGGTAKQVMEQMDGISREIQALARSRSDPLLLLANSLDFSYKPSLRKSFRQDTPQSVDHRKATELLSDVRDDEKDEAIKIISLADRKHALCRQLEGETRVKSLLKIWLYFHVPLSFALFAALAVHIFSVFFYW